MVLVADTAPSPLARTAFQSMQVFRLHIQVAISTMRPSQASKKLSAECSAKLKLRNSSTTDVTMSVRRCSRSISASIGRRGSPRARQRETCCARAMRPARKRGMERHRRVSQTVPWSPFTSMSATMLSRGKSLSQHGRHARTFGQVGVGGAMPAEGVGAGARLGPVEEDYIVERVIRLSLGLQEHLEASSRTWMSRAALPPAAA